MVTSPSRQSKLPIWSTGSRQGLSHCIMGLRGLWAWALLAILLRPAGATMTGAERKALEWIVASGGEVRWEGLGARVEFLPAPRKLSSSACRLWPGAQCLL